MVTRIITAGRNRTIDYNAGEACDAVKCLRDQNCLGKSWEHVCDVAFDHYNCREARLHLLHLPCILLKSIIGWRVVFAKKACRWFLTSLHT